MRIFKLIIITCSIVVMIILGVDLLVTKQFVYKGGRVATETEAIVLGLMDLCIAVYLLFIFIKGINKNKASK